MRLGAAISSKSPLGSKCVLGKNLDEHGAGLGVECGNHKAKDSSASSASSVFYVFAASSAFPCVAPLLLWGIAKPSDDFIFEN